MKLHISTVIVILSLISFIKPASGADNWQLMFEHRIKSITEDQQGNLYLSTDDFEIDQNGLFKSTDLGATWNLIGFEKEGDIRSIVFDTDNNLFLVIGSMSHIKRGIYRSMDNGISFDTLYTGFEFDSSYGALVSDLVINSKNELIATGNEKGTFKSTDKGSSWEIISDNSFSFITFDHSDNLYLLREDLGTFIAYGDYKTLNKLNTFVTNNILVAINSRGDIYTANDKGIMVSRNQGSSWKIINDDSLDFRRVSPEFSIFVDKNDYVYAIPYMTDIEHPLKNMIVRSTDDGATWDDFGSGVTQYCAGKFYHHSSGYMFFASEKGLFRTTDKILSASENNNNFPEVSIISDYPNPSLGETTITYLINKPSMVRIIIFNALGEMETRYNEGVKDCGIYSVKVNTTSLAPGVYYYQLLSDDSAIAAGKMIILK